MLSILITAPVGAGIIAVGGPVLLHRSPGRDRLHRQAEMVVDDQDAGSPLQMVDDQDAGSPLQTVVNDASGSASFGSVDRKNKMGEEIRNEETEEGDIVTKF